MTIRMINIRVRIAALLGLMVAMSVSGCVTTPSPIDRSALADRLARSAGMTKAMVGTNGFVLATYQRIDAPGQPLSIYIEGDGFAWKSRRQLSDDPTPIDPIALRLAVQDPAANVAYLARPCQYLHVQERRRCTQDHWSKQRFSEDVIGAFDQAISQFVNRTRASGVNLIGYSGGGAVAALVAARRYDVVSLRTVAGNLDHGAFTTHHGVTPLTGSLNPAAYGRALARVPQRHFIGTADKTIPPTIFTAFTHHLPSQRCVHLTSVPDASHAQGWVEEWRHLLTLSTACVAN